MVTGRVQPGRAMLLMHDMAGRAPKGGALVQNERFQAVVHWAVHVRVGRHDVGDETASVEGWTSR